MRDFWLFVYFKYPGFKLSFDSSWIFLSPVASDVICIVDFSRPMNVILVGYALRLCFQAFRMSLCQIPPVIL